MPELLQWGILLIAFTAIICYYKSSFKIVNLFLILMTFYYFHVMEKELQWRSEKIKYSVVFSFYVSQRLAQ